LTHNSRGRQQQQRQQKHHLPQHQQGRLNSRNWQQRGGGEVTAETLKTSQTLTTAETLTAAETLTKAETLTTAETPARHKFSPLCNYIRFFFFWHKTGQDETSFRSTVRIHHPRLN
jgi:hypothetical protein